MSKVLRWKRGVLRCKWFQSATETDLRCQFEMWSNIRLVIFVFFFLNRLQTSKLGSTTFFRTFFCLEHLRWVSIFLKCFEMPIWDDFSKKFSTFEILIWDGFQILNFQFEISFWHLPLYFQCLKNCIFWNAPLLSFRVLAHLKSRIHGTNSATTVRMDCNFVLVRTEW